MSHVIHASLFAGGLVLGVSGALLLHRSPTPVAAPVAAPSDVPGKPSVAAPTTVVDSGSAAPTPLATGSNPQLGPASYPGPVADFLQHAAYVSAYDRRLRHPAWTAEHLTAASIKRPPVPPGSSGQGVDRALSVFREDERIPEMFRARLADYLRSGYDRGHMVPAADAKSSQAAMNETFFLTNIAPQVGAGMNRDYWAHTEDFVRRLTARFADLYVFTIPLYLPRQSSDGKWRVTYEVIGNPPNVSVPTHFAKVILGVGAASSSDRATAPDPTPAAGGLTSKLGFAAHDANMLALGAFVMPNSVIPNEAPLESFAVPVETVERAAGLTLFPPAIKSAAKRLCETVKCQIIVREFNDKSKNLAALPAPKRGASM
ncbi:nuclease [Thecaphora frezii]